MERQITYVILIVSIASLIRTVNGQVCSEYGFFCDTCSTVQICQSGIATGLSLTCPDGTYCDQSSADICTTTNCTSEPYAFYECETEGRSAWVYNCSEYIWCDNTTGTLVPSLKPCPTTTVFNPNTKTCVLATTYDCVVTTTTEPTTTTTELTTTTTEATTTTTEATTTTTEPTTTTTEPTTTTTEATTTTTEPTTTTTEPTTTTTEATTTTTEPTTTTTEATTTTTEPTTTTTEATTTTTEATTTTTEATTTTTEPTTTTTEATTTTTTTTTSSTTTEATFVCSAYGRYAITTDPTCQSYNFCSPNADGTFTLLVLVCPTTTVFNPTTAKCVLPTAYTCTN